MGEMRLGGGKDGTGEGLAEAASAGSYPSCQAQKSNMGCLKSCASDLAGIDSRSPIVEAVALFRDGDQCSLSCRIQQQPFWLYLLYLLMLGIIGLGCKSPCVYPIPDREQLVGKLD